jgi:hypothetical protein
MITDTTTTTTTTSTNMKFRAELTDTFGGEANYSWVRRVEIEAPADISDLALVRRAKAALGLSGVRCVTYNHHATPRTARFGGLFRAQLRWFSHNMWSLTAHMWSLTAHIARLWLWLWLWLRLLNRLSSWSSMTAPTGLPVNLRPRFASPALGNGFPR